MRWLEQDGWTPVYIASQNGQLACLDRLIAAGADVRQAKQVSVIMLFRDDARTEALQSTCLDRLIAAGADVRQAAQWLKQDGWTPVYIASQNGQLACLDRLIAAGADVRQANQDGWTPVLIASKEGQLGFHISFT
eukprot:g46862.t1